MDGDAAKTTLMEGSCFSHFCRSICCLNPFESTSECVAALNETQKRLLIQAEEFPRQ